MRSIFGATLPLAGPSMYKALTPQWAGTLLGLMEVVLVPIPIIFYRFGDRIRARSSVIREMREEQAKDDRRRARQLEKQERLRNQAAPATSEAVAEERELEKNVETRPQHTAAVEIDETEKGIVVAEAAAAERDVEKGA